jgi:hypothetical protein
LSLRRRFTSRFACVVVDALLGVRRSLAIPTARPLPRGTFKHGLGLVALRLHGVDAHTKAGAESTVALRTYRNNEYDDKRQDARSPHVHLVHINLQFVHD